MEYLFAGATHQKTVNVWRLDFGDAVPVHEPQISQ
jgi:hypothetical protein